jgi:hypothetical protein
MRVIVKTKKPNIYNLSRFTPSLIFSTKWSTTGLYPNLGSKYKNRVEVIIQVLYLQPRLGYNSVVLHFVENIRCG